MRRAGSLRARLLLGATLWIAVALAASWVVLTELVRIHLYEQVEAELATHLDQIVAGLAFDAAGAVDGVQPLSDPRFTRPFSGLYWQVAQPDETPLRSRSLWDVTLEPPPDLPAAGELHRHALVGPDGVPLISVERMVLPPDGPPVRVVVATERARLDAPTRRFSGVLALALAMVGLGVALAALAQVLLGLRPLARLRRALGAVRNGEAARLEGAWPAEVQPLIDDLNALLEQEAAAAARARTQAGNLAHALKTPLSVLTNRAATLEDAALRRELTGGLDTMRRQIDVHLARARAAAARVVPGQRTPARAELEALARVVALAHAGRSVSIAVEAAAGVTAPCERQDFHEIAGNLLDNAAKWAAGRVRAIAEAEGDGFVLTVDDDGPGLPAAGREAVFRRGERLDETVPGAGLGLSIVRDLVETYGGAVTLEDSPLGGLRARVRLPASAPRGR